MEESRGIRVVLLVGEVSKYGDRWSFSPSVFMTRDEQVRNLLHDGATTRSVDPGVPTETVGTRSCWQWLGPRLVAAGPETGHNELRADEQGWTNCGEIEGFEWSSRLANPRGRVT